MASRAAAAAKSVDWTKVTTKLGLGQNTLSSLSSFRKRNTDARDKVAQLQSQKQTIDFDFYKQTLKNQAVVREIEQAYQSFKPATYDVQGQLKAIEQFEAKAIDNAQQTEQSIDKELTQLQETLKNIESARPFEELTVDDVMRARPDIQKNVETMVTKGRWVVPGYTDKFGNLVIM
ncbi:GAL4 enhancer protein [Savitreella phatthalungensis]